MPLNSEFLDELVLRTLAERADVFGGFYAPYLQDCAQGIAAWQRHGEGALTEAVDLPEVAESVLRSVMDGCVQIGVRTLITAFHAHRQNAMSAVRAVNAVNAVGVSPGFEAFHTWVSSPAGHDAVLRQAPELDRLLRLTVARTTRAAGTVVQTAVRERELIADVLGVQGRVTYLSPGLGDPHRGGQTVCHLRWDNGVSAVFKPQQDNCLSLLDVLRTLLDEDGSFFGPLTPTTVVRPTHVWQQFITHTDLGETSHAPAYFRRFGRVAALMSMIGASDLHHENVIATPDGPIVIDTETLVSLPNTPPPSTGRPPTLGQDVERSVLNTLLFPARFAGAKLDVDLSGVGCVRPGASEHLQAFTVVDAGTDDIRFDRAPVLVEHGPNMATVEGAPLDPRAWTGDITAGFSEARELLEAQRAAIEAVVRRSDNWSVRQVVRPTYVYARYLEASTHPAYLGSTGARAELLRSLPQQYRGVARESYQALHRDETAALLDLDVPFYSVACDSSTLRGDGDGPLHGASGSTPRQSALAAVDAFFSRPPSRDLAYIRYAMASSVDDVWDSPAASASVAARYRGRLPDLADPGPWQAELRDLVVGGDEPTLLLPQLHGLGLRLGGVNALLYDGGGLLVYLAQAEALSPAGALGVEAESLCRVATMAPKADTSPLTSPLSMSPFTGALSGLVTQREIQRRLNGANTMEGSAFTEASLHPAGPPLDVQRLSAADFDYLNGYGGYLTYLAAYGTQGAPELTGTPVEQLLQRLVTVDGDPEEHAGPLGLAHGRFGRITAMSSLVGRGMDTGTSARDHLERFASAYLRHRWQDAALRDRASSGGWCKGYAGVSYAAVTLLRALGASPYQIRADLTPEIEHLIGAETGGDISFCHGMAGRIAVLCQLADRLEWPELRTEAAALRTRFIERYGPGGWSCGISSIPDLPSFFLGLPGWYYAQLMLDHPGVELPLCLGGR